MMVAMDFSRVTPFKSEPLPNNSGVISYLSRAVWNLFCISISPITLTMYLAVSTYRALTNKNISDRKIEHVKDVQGKMHNSNLVTQPDNTKNTNRSDHLVEIYKSKFNTDKKMAEEGVEYIEKNINKGLGDKNKNLSDDKMYELIGVLLQCDKKIFDGIKSNVDGYVNPLVEFLTLIHLN